MKPVGELAFEHSLFPVATVKPDPDPLALIVTIETMLTHFRSRQPPGPRASPEHRAPTRSVVVIGENMAPNAIAMAPFASALRAVDG